jgi:hypothetical protein
MSPTSLQRISTIRGRCQGISNYDFFVLVNQKFSLQIHQSNNSGAIDFDDGGFFYL